MIKTPRNLRSYRHALIIKKLKALNPRFKPAQSGSWQTVVPLLEEPISREVIELELRNIEVAWKRCQKLAKVGAAKIHLVLHPKLYDVYEKQKCVFVREHPMHIVELYKLPTRERQQISKKPIEKIVQKKSVPTVKKPKIEDVEEIAEDTDLEEYWAKQKPKPLEQVYTKKHCVDCLETKPKVNVGDCSEYNWMIALELAKRDAVCEEL